MLLAVFGILFASLFLINNLAKTILKRTRISFWDLLLAFLAALLLGLGLLFEQLNGTNSTLLANLLVIVGGVMAVFSLFVLIAELRRPERLRQSRGVLGLGVGVLVALAAISIPRTAVSFAVPTPTPIQVAARVAMTNTPAVAPTRMTPSAMPSLTPSPTGTATLTHTPPATPTVTATRWVYQSPTPLPTATLSSPCLAIVDFNLRLRAEPNPEAETLLVIPFSTTISLYGRSEDGGWWFAEYDDQTGWIDGEFITRSASCDELPVRGS
ncbi:MAG: hypothetical protein IH587_00025 [Anaerolineae bacterium]|nr:hypothetical protein [Anaerolineae bacterium]